MFEAVQFLLRLQEALGEDVIVSAGTGGQDIVIFQATWRNDMDWAAMCAIVASSLQSSYTDPIMEQMVIQKLQNEHKLHEVGEI